MQTQRGNATSQIRLEALRARHAMLSQRIDEAQRQPSMSDMTLRQLKARKLKLRDEIESVSRSVN